MLWEGCSSGPAPASLSHFPLGQILMVVLRVKEHVMCMVHRDVFLECGGHRCSGSSVGRLLGAI